MPKPKDLSPSNALSKWVVRQLETLKPGDLLPPDPQLARRFGISQSTVKRVLKKFRDQGRLARVRGKGTFVPQEMQAASAAPAGRIRSVDSVAQLLYEQVCAGALKRGETLPPVKHYSLEWNVSRATVIAALRVLTRRQIVHKLGRNYVVGAATELVLRHPRREIFFFHVPAAPLARLYNDHTFTLGFRAMENELLRQGYAFTYVPASSFDHFSHTWKSSRRYPHGLFLAYLRQEEYDGIAHQLGELLKRAGTQRPAVLVAGKVTARRLPHTHYFNHGHANTELFRTLASYIHRNRFERLFVCYDENDHYDVTVYSTFKLWMETKHLDERIPVRYLVRNETHRSETSSQYRARLLTQFGPGYIQRGINKYSGVNEQQMASDIELVDDFRREFRRARKGDVWVFFRDHHAVEAIESNERLWTRIRSGCGVVGTENDPAFLDKALSTCVVDQHTLGYLMAHAIIGDFPVARSSRGYLNAPVMMLERSTTP
ncbi:MAG: GntR family transcriptional regulator [Chitinivibrionales bacterium]|nr:GntR family transcriptional regulator [Chitinivibrionales bacterium]MBD3396122.1 GntR family transcriptional regulator [Chitinivibrionales bacterium]